MVVYAITYVRNRGSKANGGKKAAEDVGVLKGLYNKAVGMLGGLYKALKWAFESSLWLLSVFFLLCNVHVLLSIYLGDTPVAESLEDVHSFSVGVSFTSWGIFSFLTALAYARRKFKGPIQPRESWAWAITALFYTIIDPYWGAIPEMIFDDFLGGRWMWIACFFFTFYLIHPCYGVVTSGGKRRISCARGFLLVLLIVLCLSCTSYLTDRALKASTKRVKEVEAQRNVPLDYEAIAKESYDVVMGEWFKAGYVYLSETLPRRAWGITPQWWQDRFASHQTT